MKYSDIPQISSAHYSVSVAWEYLEDWLAEFCGGGIAVDLDPDYQRGHVWTEEQQIAYVEFKLRGGKVGLRYLF